MSKLEQRKVPAADLTQRDASQWPLSKIRQNTIMYKLYYYMLSLSAVEWNPPFGQQPYYYLTNSAKYFNKTTAARVLNCDPRTISNNLNKLQEVNLIHFDSGRNSYIFSDLKYWVPMHWDIMKLFMSLGEDANWSLMIRLYALLLYAVDKKVYNFTITDLRVTLGIKNDSGAFLRLCLSWMKSLKLLDLSENQVNHPQFGTYILYNIKSIEKETNQTIKQLLTKDTSPLTEEWKQQFQLTQA